MLTGSTGVELLDFFGLPWTTALPAYIYETPKDQTPLTQVVLLDL